MDSETKMNILPVKYSKFATFAYWFLDQLKTSRIIEEDSYTAICEFTHLTDGDIPLQVAFYERFLAEYESLSKVFKALNKKPKAGKNKKSAQEKKTKTKKNNSFNANLDIISQVVLRANSVEDDFDLTTPAVSFILQDVASTQEDVSHTSVVDDAAPAPAAVAAAEEDPKEKKGKGKKVKEPKEKKEKKGKGGEVIKESEAESVVDVVTTTQEDPQVTNIVVIEEENPVVEPRKNTPILVQKKEKKEKKVKEPKEKREKKAKGGEVIKESEPKTVVDVVTTTQQEPQVNNIVLIEEEIPVLEPRKNTPILVQKKEKKVKEQKEKKEKKVKEPKEKKEKKVKEPKEKKSKKNGENKEEKPVFDSEEECAPTTINTHHDDEEKPSSQIELSVSDEIEEGNKEENEDDDDEEEDVDLYVVMVDGVEYYYDIAKNLYNQEQIIIGTFDPVTKDISYFEEK